MRPTIHITAPSSKSLSHRALICAALARGESLLEGVLDSQDLTRTADCLRLLGALVESRGDRLFVRGIDGLAATSTGEPVSMNMGESGTTCRLMTAVVTAIPGIYRVHGEGRLHDRPIGHLTDALVQQGVRVTFEDKAGYPPLVMSSPGLPGGEVTINLEQSSQYLSGLLLAAPLAASPTIVRLIGQSVASWPYVALTLDSMARFGVDVTLERRLLDDWEPCTHSEASSSQPTDIRLIVHPALYRAGNLHVEGDWSNASYFLASFEIGQSEFFQAYIIPEAEDLLEGKVVFRYMDNTNQEVVEEWPFQIDVQPAGMQGPEEPMPADPPSSGFNYWLLLIPVVLILAVVGVLFWRRKVKSGEMFNEEL